MKNSYYCPECHAVYINCNPMPEIQAMVKPGNPKANKVIYKGITMKLCPLHEGKAQIGAISSLDQLQDHEDIKCLVKALEEVANQIILKFQGVRNLVLVIPWISLMPLKRSSLQNQKWRVLNGKA